MRTQKVKFQVSTHDMAQVSSIEGAHVVEDLNLVKRPVNWKKLILDWPHMNKLMLSHCESSDVAVLIGIDQPEKHEVFDTRIPCVDAPRAIRTAFLYGVSSDLSTPRLGQSSVPLPVLYVSTTSVDPSGDGRQLLQLRRLRP